MDWSADCYVLRYNKNNMEHTNKITPETYRLIMMIGIYLSIILLLTSIIVIVKNVKELTSDPISYGIEKKDFSICSCYDMKGNSYDYNASGPMPKKAYGWTLQFEE